jgi:hypothetical protein
VHQTVYGAVGNGSDKSSPACWCKSNPDTPQKRGAGRKLNGQLTGCISFILLYNSFVRLLTSATFRLTDYLQRTSVKSVSCTKENDHEKVRFTWNKRNIALSAGCL